MLNEIEFPGFERDPRKTQRCGIYSSSIDRFVKNEKHGLLQICLRNCSTICTLLGSGILQIHFYRRGIFRRLFFLREKHPLLANLPTLLVSPFSIELEERREQAAKMQVDSHK